MSDSTNSASSLPLAFGLIVQAEFRPAEVAGGRGQIGADLGDGSLEARPCAARQFAGLGGRVGRRVLARLTFTTLT